MKVLDYPDGSIDLSVLESLLYEALERNMDMSQPVIVTSHRRVKDFNENNPEWENVDRNVQVGKLFEMYRKAKGIDYVKPSREVYEDSLKRRRD